jgi:hypothetical protein
VTTGNPNCNYDLFYCASGDVNCSEGNENTCPSNSHRKLIRFVDTPPSACITLHEANTKNELIFKTNLYANVKCPNKAKQAIKLCKLQCSIPHYKDWSQRMTLEALCPSCANYQYQTTELSEKGDWNVHSKFYVLEGSTKREISELHRLSLGQSILIQYELDGQESEDSRIILERCTLDHSDFSNAQFILVENGKVVRNTENEMINFQLNQSKTTISLLTFGNADHKDGLTSFRIQCRIFLCWGKSATDEKCLTANRSKREDQEVQALAYQSQHETVIPPLKPIGQTYVKVDNQAKDVATKITIDSRSPAFWTNIWIIVVLSFLLVIILVIFFLRCFRRKKSVSRPSTAEFIQGGSVAEDLKKNNHITFWPFCRTQNSRIDEVTSHSSLNSPISSPTSSSNNNVRLQSGSSPVFHSSSTVSHKKCMK